MNEIKNEKRLFGGMIVIENNGRILLVKDEAKTEKSALVNVQDWWKTNETVYSLPAGGRGVNEWGLEETFLQTASRELREELENERITLPRRNRHGDKIATQIYPFVVAQKRKDVIHQIGATSRLYSIDSFSKKSRKILENKLADQTAVWVFLKDLYEVFEDGDTENFRINGERTRPQLFTAAAIWYLDCMEQDLFVQERIIAGNEALISQIKEDSRQDNLPIKNGAFLENGKIAKLNKRDREFILRN